MKYTFNIDPIPKPRMTKNSAYLYTDYWNYKKELLRQAKELNYTLPDILSDITFVIAMPPSWPTKKKILMDRKPHQQRPDLDNLLKSFFDSLAMEDKQIHTLKNVRKIWGLTGQIIVYD
jgi:Holliday junction resolvase RusA-like endonuclease